MKKLKAPITVMMALSLLTAGAGAAFADNSNVKVISAPNYTAHQAKDMLIVNAKALIGTPYKDSGITPKGFDSSGFIQYVFAKSGLKLPHNSAQMYKHGAYIERSGLIEGDLVFFNTNGKGISYVGMYLFNNKFISVTTKHGVMISDMNSKYWKKAYVGGRRVM